MVDLGLFGNSLFGESLFGQPEDRICLFFSGDSALDSRAVAIHSAQLSVSGDSAIDARATAIHSALLTVIGDSELYAVGKRVRYFPVPTGLTVRRWDNKR